MQGPKDTSLCADWATMLKKFSIHLAIKAALMPNEMV